MYVMASKNKINGSISKGRKSCNTVKLSFAKSTDIEPKAYKVSD